MIYFILISVLFLYLINYHWQRRFLYKAAKQYNGPPSLPIIGNAFYFLGKNYEILSKIGNIYSSYEGPIRFWMGQKLFLAFTNPDHIEKILSSSKFGYKHEIYNLLKCVIGEGLITSSGSINRRDRRILQPYFDLRFCSKNYDIFQTRITECLNQFDKFVDKSPFDVHHLIHNCFINIVGETVLGLDIEHQKNKKEFIAATTLMYDLLFDRMIKVWLHPDIIYNNIPYYQNQFSNYKNTVQDMMKTSILESWKRRNGLIKKLDIEPVIDQIIKYMHNNPEEISNQHLLDQITTLYVASEDTLTLIASFACVCFGMYPEYQQKAANEIKNILGERIQNIKLEDLNRLTYLDMCINEVLRIVPIAPYILRRTMDDHSIGKWFVPKGCAILIPIFNLHRDPKYWENPTHFYPDHFSIENIRKRPKYAYIPFSGGCRSCIGKVFAKFAIKLILCKILQKYVIQAKGKLPDIKLKMDISTRPINGYFISLKHRF